jgi:hypothetical protein
MSANKALPLHTNIKARPKHNQNLKVLHSTHDLVVLNVWTKKKKSWGNRWGLKSLESPSIVKGNHFVHYHDLVVCTFKVIGGNVF